MSRTLRAFIATFTLILGAIPTHFALAVDPVETADDPVIIDDDSVTTEDDSVVSIDDSVFELIKKHLHIKSVNPGYKIDDIAETGEAIELINDAEISLPLSGVFLRYYNSSGNAYTLYEFPEKSAAVGRTILLRYDKSPEVKTALESATGTITEAGVADDVYNKTLAMTGSLELVFRDSEEEEKIIDAFCWTGKTGCSAKFNSSKPTTLVRSEVEGEVALEHLSDYSPTFSAGLYIPESEIELGSESEDGGEATAGGSETDASFNQKPQCLDLEFSEILAYYNEFEAEQFVELYNPTDEQIPVEGCKLKYKNKLYDLNSTNANLENSGDFKIPGDGFYVYRPSTFKFTKNPNTENELALVDVTGEQVASMKYLHGQKKGTAYALIETEWRTTYYPTPGAPNIAQEFKTCPLGKVLNEDTGNCVNPQKMASVEPCPAGKYRNPETGRCKNISSSGSSAKEPCKEGYERNPETGRCRKIKTNDGADYALVPTTGGIEKTSFVAIFALIAVISLGLGYTIFQFRKEIKYFFRKCLAKFRK